MKNLLFISLNGHVPWGGSEELWSQTATRLKDKFNVHVLVKKWDAEPKQIQALKENGIEVIYKKIKPVYKKKSILERIKGRILAKPFANVDFQIIDEVKSYDLVVLSLGNHLDTNLLKYTALLSQANIPYIIVVQLATDLRYIEDEAIMRFKESYENALKVYFLSEENTFKTEMQLGVKLLNKDLINNPFLYNQGYTPLKIADTNNFNLACVASFTSLHKAQDLLINVLSQPKWKQRNLYLNLYGNGINKKQLERLIEINGLADKIKLMGYESNKTQIWENNLACIMASRMEGQSLAMLEAMAHGRMVIGTDVGDAKRLIKDGETGFLIDAPTFELIDITLERAWNKRTEWEEMGKLCREHLFSLIKKDPVIEFAEKLEKILK